MQSRLLRKSLDTEVRHLSKMDFLILILLFNIVFWFGVYIFLNPPQLGSQGLGGTINCLVNKVRIYFSKVLHRLSSYCNLVPSFTVLLLTSFTLLLTLLIWLLISFIPSNINFAFRIHFIVGNLFHCFIHSLTLFIHFIFFSTHCTCFRSRLIFFDHYLIDFIHFLIVLNL